MWFSYLAGGALGAFIAIHWELQSLTLPLGALVALIAFDALRETRV